MKRPQSAVMVKESDGAITQHSIYKTVKEAKSVARELAMVKVRNGMQTSVHTDKVFQFPDGSSIFCREVRADGTYYVSGEGYKQHEFPIWV